MLMERPVRILHSYADVYATTALGGASTYMLIRAAGGGVSARIIGGVAVAVGARLAAARYDWRLPTYAGPLSRDGGASGGGSTASGARVGGTSETLAPRVPSGASAAARKGDDGSGVRPAFSAVVAAAFRALGT